jgi:hypothetical protein
VGLALTLRQSSLVFVVLLGRLAMVDRCVRRVARANRLVWDQQLATTAQEELTKQRQEVTALRALNLMAAPCVQLTRPVSQAQKL